MSWRFADLPIRTKFLVTLGIPVLGLVLFIGKQVDSSLKRSNVLGYVSRQASNLGLIADLVDCIQQEEATSVAQMVEVIPRNVTVGLARMRTDSAIIRLRDPVVLMRADLRPLDAVAGLALLRDQVDGKELSTGQVCETYQAMNMNLLRNLGEIAKQAMDREVNERLFAYQNLIYAKQSLNDIRSIVLRGLVHDLGQEGLRDLLDRIASYEASMSLFKRDAPSSVQSFYQATFNGDEVNLMRSLIGIIRTKRDMGDLGIRASEWWKIGNVANDRLRQVEVNTIESITTNSAEVAWDAKKRLILVLAVLLLVIGMVAIMAFVIMRGLLSTVEGVTDAAAALAKGEAKERVLVTSTDELGQMAGSFNKMIEAVRSLSASADSIGQGNYDTPVEIRGEHDVLGHSLTRMRDNLKAARERNMQHNKELLDQRDKLEKANERIAVLIREIHHRVKNNLQVVSSMLRLQAGTIADKELQQVFAQTQSRVASMALIHEKLYRGSELATLNLSQYIRELFAELVQLNKVEGKIRYRTAIDPDLSLDLDTMVPLGLILNELITNSFKHAFLGKQEGFINLRMHRTSATRVDLDYSDNGGGIPQEKQDAKDDTLGRNMIDSLVEQLNGTINMETGPEGTRYRISFTAPAAGGIAPGA